MAMIRRITEINGEIIVVETMIIVGEIVLITVQINGVRYDVYRRFEQPLLKEGWDVIVFVPSKEEDSDRITCGNALISEEKI